MDVKATTLAMETKGMLPTDEVLALPTDLRDLNQSTIWTSSKKCEGLESQVITITELIVQQRIRSLSTCLHFCLLNLCYTSCLLRDLFPSTHGHGGKNIVTIHVSGLLSHLSDFC